MMPDLVYLMGRERVDVGEVSCQGAIFIENIGADSINHGFGH